MNRNEKLEIAKRLRHLTEMEMSSDDLAALLDAELNKPEAEMDAELVQQLLELMEEAPTQEQQQEAWQKTSKRLKCKQWRPVAVGLARSVAAVAILMALMFTTYGTARALNWESLLRWMRPFAETFLIYSGDEPAPTPEPEVKEVYSDVGLDSTQAEFTTLADCPDKVGGYPAKPVWMPERFSYLQGSMYSDLQVTSISHLFSSSEGWCIMDITKFRSNEDATTYYFEQLPANNTNMYIAKQQVALYHNTDNATLTASWLSGNTSYFITGSISEEEIVKIIETMMK